MPSPRSASRVFGASEVAAPSLLRGLAAPQGGTPVERRAAEILIGLGAEAGGAGRPAVEIQGDLEDDGRLPGLPAGVATQALALALAAATVDAELHGQAVGVSAPGVLAQLYLPAVMAAAYGALPARHCPPPLAVGSGAVQADLGAEGSAESFATMVAALDEGERRDPERLAAAAQVWRLPVLPYRSAERGVRGEVAVAARATGSPGAERRGVLDLTAMWAGPLASWLLAAAGDRVEKVEPTVRLDGMRALDGRGIHPPGADPASGGASAMFNALNRGKRRLDLDLREPAARRELLDRAAGCDLVLESFSPRVLGNLRIGHEVLAAASPGITVISLPALPPDSAAAGWVAYGAGVHAIGGLGETDTGFAAPAFAYPDALAGLQAYLLALAVRFGRARGDWAGGHLVAPMSAALPPPGSGAGGLTLPAGGADRLGADLLREGGAAEFAPLVDAAGSHRYPRSPFRGGATVAERAAPTFEPVMAGG
jgi:CoA-transferase family III